MSISNRFGYRCPKCKYAWSTYTKDYNGYVYCSSKKCNHRFKNEQVKFTQYCFYESTSNRDEMIEKVEKYLQELKAFDNIYDDVVCKD